MSKESQEISYEERNELGVKAGVLGPKQTTDVIMDGEEYKRASWPILRPDVLDLLGENFTMSNYLDHFNIPKYESELNN